MSTTSPFFRREHSHLRWSVSLVITILIFAAVYFLVDLFVLSSFDRVIVELESNISSSAKIYWSSQSGSNDFTEKQAKKSGHYEAGVHQAVRFDIDNRLVKRLRLDPGQEPGKYIIGSVTLLNFLGQTLVIRPHQDMAALLPSSGVHLNSKEDSLEIVSSTDDPFVIFDRDLVVDNLGFRYGVPLVLAVLSFVVTMTIQPQQYKLWRDEMRRSYFFTIPLFIFVSFGLITSVHDHVMAWYFYTLPLGWAVLVIYSFIKGFGWLSVSGYLLFLTLLYAEALNFEVVRLREVMLYALFSFGLSQLFALIYRLLAYFGLHKTAPYLCIILFTFLSVLPTSFIIYNLNFDSKISKEILYAIFQTNGGEAYEYLYDFISYKLICAAALFFILCMLLFFRQAKSRKFEMNFPLLGISFLMTILALPKLPDLNLPSFIFEAHAEYIDELEQYRKVASGRGTGKIHFEATKSQKGETYIVVIGESLNKKHMGIYGYFRETTPNLSEMLIDNNLLVFENAYSNHTHTGPVLKRSLTESNLYNGKNLSTSLSILEILKKAGVKTYWVTNQVLYSVYDNPVTALSSVADELIPLNNSVGIKGQPHKFDSGLIDKVQKILNDNINETKVIFVHLYGNHGSYELRYPHNMYKKFYGPLPLGDFGTNASENRYINHYDNSVLFNDYVVSSLLKSVVDGGGVAAFVYMSDHADDVIAGKGHSIGQFTYEMTEIPLIFGLSDAYQDRYPDKYGNLVRNRNMLFSNDLLYDTLIGLASVVTNNYEEQHDLTSLNYSLSPENALIIVGGQKYDASNNYIWWQKSNIIKLRQSNQSLRIIPHRVNSVGKLKDIWRDGYRSLEVDVLFDDVSNQFIVGHNDGVMGHNLEHFLSSIDIDDLERVWLDIKNMTSNNKQAILEYLNLFNEKFQIKDKFLIESNYTGRCFSEFARSGWKTSYYLPTGNILELLEDGNDKKMIKVASQLSGQIKVQELSAISFDTRLRPFVKNYLEDLIDDEIVYHCWLGPHLANSDLFEKLKMDSSYRDTRVKTLLVHYKSQFNL